MCMCTLRGKEILLILALWNRHKPNKEGLKEEQQRTTTTTIASDGQSADTGITKLQQWKQERERE